MQNFTIALVLVLVGPFACHAATLPDGCGSGSVEFKVKTEKKMPVPASSVTGDAQVIFMQSLDGDFPGAPITRFAVDGAWVGAVKGESYFVVSIAPGSHKICAARQSRISLERGNVGTAAVHLDTGKTYFYNFKITRNEIGAASGHAAGQALGYSSPDMTIKPKDTIDTADFQKIDNATGIARTQKIGVSAGTLK